MISHPQPPPENRSTGQIENIFSSVICYLCLGSIVLLLFLAGINAQYGLEDWRMVDGFEQDEAHVIQIVQANIANHDFDPRGYYHYPYLWFSVGIAIIRASEAFGYHIDVRFIGAVFREISLIGGAAAAFFSWQLLLLLGVPTSFALLGAAFLLTTPDFYYWSHMVHPDVPQAALILLAFVLAFKRPTFVGALQSAAANGAAASFKFAGIFSFPFCVLHDWWVQLVQRQAAETGRSVIGVLLRRAVVVGVLALGIFVATNPYAVINFHSLVEGVSFIKNTIGKPYVRPEPWSPFTWIKVIARADGQFANPIFVVGLSSLIISWLFKFGRYGFKQTFRNDSGFRYEFILFLYALSSLAIMTFAVQWTSFRYAYHFYPVVIILAFVGVFRLLSALRFISPQYGALCLACLVVLRSDEALRHMSFASNKPVSVIVKAGSFIADHYPKDTVIFFENASYVPAVFTSSRVGPGITEAVFTNINPKVIVLHSQMSGRWIWKAEGTKFAEGKFVGDPNLDDRARETYKIYTRLVAPETAWKVVFEEGDVVVLERPDSKGTFESTK